ncbi:MAG: uroporphyrinogen-III C-methyltransferase [Alphaproteobacteria bacterium]|nr:uroporphyrinogen-III C-methyltransferase [Alphaproteobacteria bacterium]
MTTLSIDTTGASAGAARPWPVSIVGAGAGDISALTLGAADVLASADVVLVDDLVDDSILKLIPEQAEVVPVGKRGGQPSTSQTVIIDRLIEEARNHRRVVRLKGGDPFLYGRGAEEAEALTATGLEVAIYPGVTAAFAAASSTGIPLTYRGVASHVSFITATLADGSLHPVKGLAGPGRTLVVYMGRHAADRLAESLDSDGVSPQLPIAVVVDAGRTAQRLEIATVGTLPEAVAAIGGQGPLLTIIGDVVAKRVACVSAPARKAGASAAYFAHG